jgi:hypothetical protein
VRLKQRCLHGDASFCNWPKRLSGPSTNNSGDSGEASFLDLSSLMGASPSSGPDWNFVLSLGSGVKLRLSQNAPFRYIKQVFGYDKVRFRGLAKNNNRLHLLAAFSNLLIGVKYMLAHGPGRLFSAKLAGNGQKTHRCQENSVGTFEL